MSLFSDEPIIYLITKGEVTDSNFETARREMLDIVRLAVDEKVSLIQIREKKLSAKRLFELTVAVVEITHGSATRVLVNDRADIAFAAKANGVHLAAHSLSPVVIRENFPPEFMVGVSAHTLSAVEDAAKAGANFAVFAPIFEIPGKGEAKGLTALSEVCEKVRPFPVLGLGGIDETNCESVIAAGARGVAAIRSLNDPASRRAICGKLRK